METSHPEIASGIASAELELIDKRHDLLSLDTSIDLLEVFDPPSHPNLWRDNLDHEALKEHVQNQDQSLIPALRIFFCASSPKADGVQVHPFTLRWLQSHFSISAIFLQRLTSGDGGTGNAFFRRRNEHGRVIGIHGFYSNHTGLRGPPTCVWFSYDLLKRTATYLTANCSPEAKNQIIHLAQHQNAALLTRPCAIDTFIADYGAYEWEKAIELHRRELLKYEAIGASQLPSPTHTSHALEALHGMSQHWHRICEHLAGGDELLGYLLDVLKNCTVARAELQGHLEPQDGMTQSAEDSTVDESLTFLVSRNHSWKRWVSNYNERTKIRIDLFFNLASQSDNRTNLSIANLTSDIAVETQRDSSSMITMAAVTMFFLPGTFVSALFSMVFFSDGADADGKTKFTVSPRLWYFFVVTIPLTILVFVVWIFWQRWRESAKVASFTEQGESSYSSGKTMYSQEQPTYSKEQSIYPNGQSTYVNRRSIASNFSNRSTYSIRA